jgi:O-acetyl-ADP-ribose deacetylase (regulator of RNase III)
MIEFVQGNLFDADVEAIINAVNCVGVMGKGIALEFKKRFPDNFIVYKVARTTPKRAKT